MGKVTDKVLPGLPKPVLDTAAADTGTRVPVPGPEETPVRKRGRPPGARNKPRDDAPVVLDEDAHARWEKEGEEFAEDVRPYLAIISGYLEARFGPRWRFTDDELARLTRTTGTLLAKYLPAWLSQYREEAGFVRAWASVVGSKALDEVLNAEPAASKEVPAEVVTP